MRIACLMPDDGVYASTCRKLAPHGFDCVRRLDDASLLRMMQRHPVDIVLVDVGLDAAMEYRLLLWTESRPMHAIPVILQTPHLHTERSARALLAGVDDVVVRTTDVIELVARLQASVRRHHRYDAVTTINFAGYHLDRTTRLVRNRYAPIELTAREFALAWLLFSHAGTCLSRRTISVVVWGLDEEISNRSMEQCIHRLRRKLGLDESRGVTIRAVYGKGYQITELPVPGRDVDGRPANEMSSDAPVPRVAGLFPAVQQSEEAAAPASSVFYLAHRA